MKKTSEHRLVYLLSVVISLSVGLISALVNRGNLNTNALVQPALSPLAWIFPLVWTLLFTLMGISSAKVYLSGCADAENALFLNAVQLLVNFLWTVFFFSFQALLLSVLWLIFLLLLVLLTAATFERCSPGAGKLQIPYILWLCFALYLNIALWLLNK